MVVHEHVADVVVIVMAYFLCTLRSPFAVRRRSCWCVLPSSSRQKYATITPNLLQFVVDNEEQLLWKEDLR